MKGHNQKGITMAKAKKTDTENTKSGTDSEAGIGTLFVRTRKTYAKTKELKVVKEKEPPRRTGIKEPLTKDQRDELRELITEWVTTANLAKKPLRNGFGTAWSNLYELGLNGDVNGIEQIEQFEFEHCRTFIKQRIAILETADRGGLTRRKDEFRNKRIRAIQVSCKANGITEEKRKVYMLNRWNKDSLTLLTDDQLDDCYHYAISNPPPKWNIPRVEILGTQPLREKALSQWLIEQEAKARDRGEAFDRWDIQIPGGKQAAIEELARTNRVLFADDDGEPIDIQTFNKCLTKARLCKFHGGRPRGQKT